MTADKIVLAVQGRNQQIEKNSALRKAGQVVANIVVPHQPSVAIKVGNLDFKKIYEKAGESTLVYLVVDGEAESRPVLIDEVAFHPVDGSFIHVVFKQVNLKEKVTADVPVEVIGEFKVPGAVLLTVKDSVEVNALPADLPEKFVIDAAKLTEVGQSIKLSDLEFDHDKVSLVLGEDEVADEVTVVLVQEEKQQAEPEETEVAEGETAEAAPEAAAEGQPADKKAEEAKPAE